MTIIKKIKYPLTIVIIILIVIITIIIKHNLNKNKYEIIQQEELDNLEIIGSKQENNDDIDKCTVDIKGAIYNPGVYTVDCTKNVSDIIKLSGGLKEEADTSIINLAKKINNEMVIIIYTKEEVKNSNVIDTVVKVVEKECICPNIKNDGCINTNVDKEINNNDNELININTASIELLQTLSGIGESKAKAIIKYREENGNFKNIEEILKVDGIGQKLYEEIKVYITT